MAKQTYLFFLFSTIINVAYGNLDLEDTITGAPTYFIEFKYKKSLYSIDEPESFLSRKSILRRAYQGIQIDSSDLPISTDYLKDLQSRFHLKIKGTTRWLNGVLIELADSAMLEEVKSLPYIKAITFVKPGHKSQQTERFVKDNGQSTSETLMYSLAQVDFHQGLYLHNKGLLGKGIDIAVIDAGFLMANQNPLLQHLFENRQILALRNFVSEEDIFSTHGHGTSVLSILAGYSPGIYTGAAPEANYYLLQSEDAKTEYLIEEINWAMAAEYADSLGADILNTSLGYTTFNDASMNHTYADLDGKTTFISRASAHAANKGMLVVNSAGNLGDDPWHFISAPGDVPEVLTVGAVSFPDTAIANFSGRGPNADGMVKPDVVGVGVATLASRPSGQLVYSNGTSNSSPIIAGLAACLWQSAAYSSANEIRNVIKMSSHQYLQPDNIFGYGLPNFKNAYALLNKNPDKIDMYIAGDRNEQYLFIQDYLEVPFTIEIFSLAGQLIHHSYLNYHSPQTPVNLKYLVKGNGIFIIRVKDANQSGTIKYLK